MSKTNEFIKDLREGEDFSFKRNICLNCGRDVTSNKQFCTSRCRDHYLSYFSAGDILPPTLSKHGTQTLARVVIMHALLSEDMEWFNTGASNFYCDLACVNKGWLLRKIEEYKILGVPTQIHFRF